MLDDHQVVEAFARKLASQIGSSDWTARIDDAKSLIADLPELGYVSPNAAGTIEWAVQERTVVDGPWDRIDDGAGWSNRYGRLYTEEEARDICVKAESRQFLWRRVVTRTVRYGSWETAERTAT
jgi:hypothetical protein